MIALNNNNRRFGRVFQNEIDDRQDALIDISHLIRILDLVFFKFWHTSFNAIEFLTIRAKYKGMMRNYQMRKYELRAGNIRHSFFQRFQREESPAAIPLSRNALG